VDVFSLGCLIHFVVEDGGHPFGEWHERHANVMKGRRDISALEPRSPELHDLVRRCTEQKPGSRPAAKDVAQHPFFWDAAKRVRFLAAVSDRLLLAKDLSTPAQREQRQRGAALLQRLGLARGVVPRARPAATAAAGGWSAHFDDSLFESGAGKRRVRYDFSSTCDALRFLRNKWAHSMELDPRAKALLGESAASFLAYFTSPARIPGLVLMCYRVVQLAFPDDAAFASFGVVAASAAELDAAANAAPSPPLLDGAAPRSASAAHSPRRLDAGAGDAPSAGRSRGKRGKRGKEAREARSTTPLSRRKTKLCRDWRNGACARGDECGFAHGAAELRE
jgi:serine/threonine-protein kinase/endoribonuclease IRE1